MQRRLSALTIAIAACSSSHAPTSTPAPTEYEKTTLYTAFRAEGVAVFDVDRDGHLDVVTDQYWYEGPTFAAHELRAPEAYDPHGYSKCQAIFGEDVDGDGFTDAIVVPFPFDPANPPPEPMLWYQNPRGAKDARWAPHVLAPATAVETAIFEDLFGDGHRVIVMGQDPPHTLAWFAPVADPTQPWVAHAISASGFDGAGHFAHGLGAGDVDGDGKLDVLTGDGWFQQTSDRATWTFHPFAFGPDACSDMFAYDVDADGLADVLCSRPHDYGLHWWRQSPAGSFTDVVVDTSVSQMHALDLVDLDGDGVPELVSGKRWWAHGPTGDPGATDPAVLVYYAIRRAGLVTFERHVIDDASGIGTQFPVVDVDGDGKPDVVVSNKRGLFVFRRH